MKPILVLYATREGQTRRIAEYVGLGLRKCGFEVDVFDASAVSREFPLALYETAVLAASVHIGKHEKEMVAFVASHRKELERMKASFLSVSGSQIGAENPAASTADRERCAADAQIMIDRFIKDTGWTPARTLPVAGAMMYLKYSWLVRIVMRMISKRSGGSTDTSRNTEYTDWAALDRFVEGLAREIRDESCLSVAA